MKILVAAPNHYHEIIIAFQHKKSRQGRLGPLAAENIDVIQTAQAANIAFKSANSFTARSSAVLVRCLM